MSSGRRRPERSDGITVFTVAVARNGQPIQNRPSRSLERIVHQEPRRSHVTIFPSQPNQPPQIPARRRRRHCGHGNCAHRRERSGPDQHALAEHMAVKGHLSRIRTRLCQEPLGAQLVGPLGRDARLLRTATALIQMLRDTNKGNAVHDRTPDRRCFPRL
jgi:Asp-tRNA(Asn)/Glu-tRNA(Gln) amidotransferase A subunit family amidase